MKIIPIIGSLGIAGEIPRDPNYSIDGEDQALGNLIPIA